MFLEINARAVNEKWIINLNNVIYILPYEGGTRFYFVGDNEPLDAEEDYKTILYRISGVEEYIAKARETHGNIGKIDGTSIVPC